MEKTSVVSGPVIIEGDKTLLNISGSDDFWKFCGGRVKEGEYFSETAIRRAKEEMGFDIQISGIEPFTKYALKKTAEGNIDVLLVHFLASRVDEITPGNGTCEWRWFTAEELVHEKLASNILPALKHFGFL